MDEIKWHDQPENDDYPAAESYLTLIYGADVATQLVTQLRASEMTRFKAKDIFRASNLPLLGISEVHIQKRQQDIARGKKLTPILLVRDDAQKRLHIADGYHRMCAVYIYDADAWIPVKMFGIR